MDLCRYKNVLPSWEQKKYSKEQRLNKLLPVIVPMNGSHKNGNALRIHQDTSFYISSLTQGSEVGHELKVGRKAYVFVIEGEIQINDKTLETRDAAKIQNENNLSIKAARPTELIIIDLPEKYAMNK